MSLHWLDVPPLISALFLASLGVVALASGKPRRLWGSFAAFCLLMAAACTAGFLGPMLPASDPSRIYIVRSAGAFGSLGAVFGVFYAFILAGEERVVPRFFPRFFGRALTPGRMLAVVLFYGLVPVPLLIATDLFIAKLDDLPTGVVPTFGPLIWLLAAMMLGALIKIVWVLHRAAVQSEDPALQRFLKLNASAFRGILGPGLAMVVLLPSLGLSTQPFAFLFFPIAVVVFYIAIVRYQIARVRQANEGLEEKVRERTRELEQAQTQLAQAEKMASLGQLVAGVAHEMNTPLGALKSTHDTIGAAARRLADELREAAPELGERRKVKNALRVLGHSQSLLDESTKRLEEVVTQLRAFARLDEADQQQSHVGADLEATLALLRGRLERVGVVIEREGLDALPELLCQPRQLNQVFMHLLTNAIEAIEAKQRVATSGYRGTIRLRGSYDSEAIELRVCDDGIGIERGVEGRVFDPGYTQKGVGVGTGLGLAICQQVIERDHNGEIALESRQGEGTTVTIRLPRRDPV
ncbi:MAG: hypothetical protein CSA65_09390 [Proteobacteria bacterium]|nr:MAG: hypothetical protein CSB49_07955 [Pseudomonadota bacterium]PIE17307.1 MAG: hypothetical protein CSA65_09390 [Pseudomonadota bacterium]